MARVVRMHPKPGLARLPGPTMRAPLSLCLPLIALAVSGCHAHVGARAASRAPIEDDRSAAAPEAVGTPALPVATSAAGSGTVAPDLTPAVQGVLASPRLSSAAAPPAEAEGGEVEGTIVARQGTRITIRIDDETAIVAGERGQLLRHFERRLGSATLDGWLDVARVTVLSSDGRAVELSIDEETARVMINGRKQDQFRVGFRVRLQGT